jgi:hypothetical protein
MGKVIDAAVPGRRGMAVFQPDHRPAQWRSRLRHRRRAIRSKLDAAAPARRTGQRLAPLAR